MVGPACFHALRKVMVFCTNSGLTDENGRRVAAFGYWAGYAGTAIALLSWAHQLLNPGKPHGPVPAFDTASALTGYVKSRLQEALGANSASIHALWLSAPLDDAAKET
ncbi:hypothetical protein DL771_011523 [Monosporascus sp. 5C6A]|nr:hypothetical protein DL771_011523 [Monosporascus sp. 5C6A]